MSADTDHHEPVDLEFVERLGQAEVVDAEEDGAEEADHHHGQEPVLAVGVGGGAAHDAEERQNLEQDEKIMLSCCYCCYNCKV